MFAPKGFFKGQLINNGALRMRIYPAILFAVRWIAPVMIAMVLISYFVK